tara:strand:+ start:1359 stop:1505 length:147 start_codon:yes stop_codon:yes gene_type:complete
MRTTAARDDADEADSDDVSESAEALECRAARAESIILEVSAEDSRGQF